MSTNDAPEKIYIRRIWGSLAASQMNITGRDVEYTRTDAFIEKACEYLQKNLWIIIDEEPEFRQRFVTDFEKYMKGE